MTGECCPDHADMAKGVIERQGRWLFLVYVSDGIVRYGPNASYGGRVFGRRRAERKARKMLARYLAQRDPERWEVQP